MKRLSESSACMLLAGLMFVNTIMGGSARADVIWGIPTKVPNLNTSSCDGLSSLTSDGLELYFVSYHPHGGDACFSDIWVATRSTVEDDWGEPVKLGPPVNSDGPEGDPCISADGLELYFSDGWGPLLVSGCTHRPGGYGNGDIWVSTRATRDEPWGVPRNLGSNVNSGVVECHPAISADGLSLYFSSYGGDTYGSFDLNVTERATKDDPWGPAVNLGPLFNTSNSETYPFVSPDNLSLYFSSGLSTADIYVSRRASVGAPWQVPVPVEPVNSPLSDYHLTFVQGDLTLYFNRSSNWNATTPATWPTTIGTLDMWQVQVTPIFDFDGDGVVDVVDAHELLENWGARDKSLYDIAPLPLGDGVVDEKDLILLAEDMGRYPDPVAHWRLDETEGNVAHDSVNGTDDYVVGDPVWQPTAGRAGGALELDGVDDCIITRFSLNAADGPFSVFVWVKGGGPGQVAVSQATGSNWLAVDVEGKLMTELKSPSPDAVALHSQAVIADGSWHRIGVIWDGLNRMICVDGVIVAEDRQNGLHGADNGLYIGVGQDYAAGTFFSGLVDDVRIYDREVNP